ncbi:Anaerobic magnesium-protoporphyrin IX monomethyl ester cyclase [bioreactor metagenome]|uniref:Anaerobic magnesium-protoporphyrin IX monomethyl ester cyclase n=1 Tax=bioreactor metagenome TaxID=1076179 RepID=A0A644UGX0_9ZZZZ|nr:radical SAM protein [Methanobrevibacter sp.]MEA4957710.1 radical SAM protein [Methanobrevibacter sp.]
MKSALVYINNFGVKTIFGRGPDSTWINHGISLIIAYCNQLGEKIDLINMGELSSWDEFNEKIRDYDIVGYSIVSPDVGNAFKAIEINKKANHNAVICVGGVDPSVDIDKYKSSDMIDQIIIGEGEIAFYNLICDVKNNNNVKKVVIGDKIEDLDNIDFINRDLWQPEFPRLGVDLETPYATVLSGRACIYNCSFCQPATKKIFGNKERIRSPKNFVNELQMLKEKHGMKSFYILDDNVLQNRDWLECFIREYEMKDINCRFMISGRADNIYKNRDLFPKLKELGLSWCCVGFESGSDKILKYLKKGSSLDLNLKASDVLKSNGVNIIAFIMFGFPIETKEDIYSSLKFIKKINPRICEPSTYTPFPGTVLYEDFKNKNLLYSLTSTVAPNAIKIKGVKYIYIHYIIFRIVYSTSKDFKQKLFNVIYQSYLGFRVLIDFFTRQLIE